MRNRTLLWFRRCTLIQAWATVELKRQLLLHGPRELSVPCTLTKSKSKLGWNQDLFEGKFKIRLSFQKFHTGTGNGSLPLKCRTFGNNHRSRTCRRLRRFASVKSDGNCYSGGISLSRVSVRLSVQSVESRLRPQPLRFREGVKGIFLLTLTLSGIDLLRRFRRFLGSWEAVLRFNLMPYEKWIAFKNK